MNKSAQNQYPVNDLSKNRWSPRAFSDQAIEKEKLQCLFEAARWSASAGNEQPWRYLIGIKDDETWTKIFETLDEGNKPWTEDAPVLLLAIGKKTRGKRNSDNFYYAYDTGQSMAHLSLEAMNQGLFVHQMAGFSVESAREKFSIPDDYQPLTAIALGYLGKPDSLNEDQKESEVSVRKRKDFSELVFSGSFGKSSNLFK